LVSQMKCQEKPCPAPQQAACMSDYGLTFMDGTLLLLTKL
jgi:hypothetical protein